MTSSPKQPVLLFVDDEPDIVDIAKMCFEMSGWAVCTADNITMAKQMLADNAVDAVLSDIMMRGGTGLDLLEWARKERGSGFVFFLLTGCIDERVARAKEQGAHGVFNKPCDWNAVVKALEDALLAASTKELVDPN